MKPAGSPPSGHTGPRDQGHGNGSAPPSTDHRPGGRGRRRRRGRRWRRGREHGGSSGGGQAHPRGGHAPAGHIPAGENSVPRERTEARAAAAYEARGVLELTGDGGGFLRQPQRNYRPSHEDPYVPREMLAPFSPSGPAVNGGGIEGIEIEGMATGRGTAPAHEESRGGGRHHRGHESQHRRGGRGGPRLTEIRTINALPPDEFARRRPFSTLTSIDPFERIRLETDPQEISTRVIDLLTPIGKGQRCLVVAPPRAGKTTLLQKIASAISRNHPEIQLVVLLVDERPEEVTDMKRNVRGEVIASSSDEMARQHVSIARIVLERARRLVEVGHDVVILLDSLTRLARAHNAATPGTGRTLSGGLDARTMEQPRRLFGAARKAEEGGSLTVIATALVDTGSRMDDVIFQEFKGTGNMELVLDRSLFEQRIYPAVDIARSGTRKEEKLFAKEDIPRIHRLRRALFDMKPHDAMMKLIDKLAKFPSNAAFLRAIDG
jgi:transcription termination factor Rho